MAAARDNGGKPRVSLVPTKMLKELAKVLEFGQTKYGLHNWRQGGDTFSYHFLMDSALRHAHSMLEGEDLDKESGLPHAAHVISNMAFLLELQLENKLIDDRYKG